MEQGFVAVMMTMLILFIFLPAFYYKNLESNRAETMRQLSAATRAIEDCVLQESTSIEDIAQGYAAGNPIKRIRIDEGKLLTEFDNILYKNINNPRRYNKIQEKIVCKILVYPDRVIITDEKGTSVRLNSGVTEDYYSYSDQFDRYTDGLRSFNNIPRYFKYDVGGTEYFINTIDNVAKLNPAQWDAEGVNFTTLRGAGYNPRNITEGRSGNDFLTDFDRAQQIITLINADVMGYTDGLMINLPNPYNTYEKNQGNLKQNFNFFTGITFLVIYKDTHGGLNITGEGIKFNQYSIAGYTLETTYVQ